MVRSNFTQVRMSKHGDTLQVTGTSDTAAGIRELHVAVAAPLPVDPLLPFQDLAPVDDQVVATLPGPVVAPWRIDVPITPGMFSRGDLVLLAGTAIHDEPTDGEPALETWIGATTVMASDDPK